MTEVYRLIRAARRAEVLSGEGARLYGGRWNRPGAAVVYASESRALAVLETFVHLTLEARSMKFLLCTLALPAEAAVKRHGTARPPRSLDVSQRIGASWLAEGADLAFVVPSALVPQEKNYVLDVRHPRFAEVRVAKTEPFSFDERLWQPQR